MHPAHLLLTALALPLTLLLLSSVPVLRRNFLPLLVIAPLPALAAALYADNTPLRLGTAQCALWFALDAPGRMLLLVATLLWMAAGLYVALWLRSAPQRGSMVVCWLLTLTGCIGVFLAADLVSFYFTLALLSIGTCGLVLQGGTPEAQRGASVYLAVALLGEAFLLCALVLMAVAMPAGNLLISDAAAALPNATHRDLILSLLLLGLGMKVGLVPSHFWMPLAHGSAPIPASAVMSGIVVKAGALAALRFLPSAVPLPSFGIVLTAFGLGSAFYAVLVGITQTYPKMALAYSSVSQMGLVFAIIGIGMSSGDPAALQLGAFYAAHHLLVKGALFLAVGAMANSSTQQRFWLVLAPAALLALGIAGLPLTGGFLAKTVVKPLFAGAWLQALATLSALGSTVLMLHFLRLLHTAPASAPTRGALLIPWWLMFIAALSVPWLLYRNLGMGDWVTLWTVEVLWKALWPLLVGLGAAVVLWRYGERYLPQLPAGDIAAFGPILMRCFASLQNVAARLDTLLRQWTVAGLALLLVLILLCSALLSIPAIHGAAVRAFG